MMVLGIGDRLTRVARKSRRSLLPTSSASRKSSSLEKTGQWESITAKRELLAPVKTHQPTPSRAIEYVELQTSLQVREFPRQEVPSRCPRPVHWTRVWRKLRCG